MMTPNSWHGKKRLGTASSVAVGILAMLGRQRAAYAVLGIDVTNDEIDNSVFVNDSVQATPLYSPTTYTPTFGIWQLGIPFNANYGQGAILDVVDLGLVDNTDPALTQVGTYFNINLPSNPQANPPSNLIGEHGTNVARFAGGYNSTTTDGVVATVDFGIAPLVTLWSGSIISGGDPNGNNTQTNASVIYPFVQAMNVGVNGTTADVINASFGATGVPASQDWYSQALDGLAAQNPHTTVAIAAGNSDSQPTQVSSPAASFNNIAVAALGADPTLTYQNVASFSNRGPNDFFNPYTNQTIANARASIDIAAPGDEFITTATPIDGQPGNYEVSYGSGTSFATPLVSGAIAQLDAYAHGLSYYSGDLQMYDALAPQRITDATDSRVIKAVLMNSADKTSGWNNGQTVINGILATTQGLDYNVGAGRLNIARAADNYLNGIFDPQVVGYEYVGPKGWDLSTVTAGMPNVYDLGILSAGQTLTSTLDWFADTSFDYGNLTASADRFANLNLEIFEQVSPTTWTEIAISDALYNNVQQLSFTLNDTADYQIEVIYAGVQYAPPGDTTDSEEYAVAWSNVNVPEPAAVVLGVPMALLMARRRHKR